MAGRKIFNVFRTVAQAVIGTLRGRRRVYPVFGSYLLLMGRVPYFFQPRMKPRLVHIRSTFGFGVMAKIVRKRAALAVEIMLLHHLEYKRAKAVTDHKRDVLAHTLAKRAAALEARVVQRITASITIQRVFRGFSKRLVYCAAMQARNTAKRLAAEICNAAAIWKRAQELWAVHKGFLGCVRVHSLDVLVALGRKGMGHFKLLPELSPDNPSQALVGGRIRVFFSLEPLDHYPVKEVQLSMRRLRDGNGKAPAAPLLCIHDSVAPGPKPEAPTVLKIQLVGVSELLQGLPVLKGPDWATCRVFLCGNLVATSSRPLPSKLEPSFHDEILYVSIEGCSPLPSVPFLRLDFFSPNGGVSLGRLSFGCPKLLGALGKATTAPLMAGTGEYHAAVLLGIEPAHRTRSRTIAQEVVHDLLVKLKVELDALTPRVELSVLHAEVDRAERTIEPEVYLDMSCLVSWTNGELGSTKPVQAGYSPAWKDAFVVEVPDDFPEEEIAVTIKLKANTSVVRDATLATASLGHRDLYFPRGHRKWFPLIAGEGQTPIGRVQVSITTKHVRKPYWKKRLEFTEREVPRWIRQGIKRIPQPRVEFNMMELREMHVTVRNLVAKVYWRGKLRAEVHEKRRVTTAVLASGPSEVKSIVYFDRSVVYLFFAADHDWTKPRPPPFWVEVWGEGPHRRPTPVAQIRLSRDDLLLMPRTRAAQLLPVQPTEPEDLGVVRKLKGVFTCMFTPCEIPPPAYQHLHLPHPQLCLTIFDLRHELSTQHAVLFMQGLYWRVLWKGVEVARTARAKSATAPQWTGEVFMIPLKSTAEHPSLTPAIPLFLQIFRMNKDGADELVGEVVPFNGKLQVNIPCAYYPFDVLAATGGKREGKVIGQIGLAFSIEMTDIDKETSKVVQQDVVEEHQAVSAEDIHNMAGPDARERARKYSLISGLQKTEKDAKELLDKAKEASESNPRDKHLQQYVRLLEAEHDRARRAAREAKLHDAAAHGGKRPATPTSPAKATTKRVHLTGKAKLPSSPQGLVMSESKKNLLTRPTKEPAKVQAPDAPSSNAAAKDAEEPGAATAKRRGVTFQEGAKGAPVVTPLDKAAALIANPVVSPPLAVLEPSLYLRIVKVKGVSSLLRTTPRVHVYWCGRRVITTGVAKQADPQEFVWPGENYVLPLPNFLDKADLRLELWSANEFCGQMIIEGLSLKGECVRADAPPGRLVTEYQLSPKDHHDKANTFGKLALSLIELEPEDYRPLAQEVKALVNDTIRTTLQGEEAGQSALLRDDPSDERLSPGHINFIGKTFLRRQLSFKLQILRITGLPKAGTLDDTDPYVVVSMNDTDIGKTPTIDNTMNPIFGTGMATFEIPASFICDDSSESSLTLKVFDQNMLAMNQLLGQLTLKNSDLRGALNRVVPFTFELEINKKLANIKGKGAAEPHAPAVLYLAAHFVRRIPGPSRIELKLLSLQDVPDMPLIGSKNVTFTVSWNDQELGQTTGTVTSSGQLKTDTTVFNLPYDCEGLERRRFSEYPTRLKIDFYHGKPDGKMKFLGQIDTCGPFGLVVEGEDAQTLGADYRTATYRLAPKPYMLEDRDADVAGIGGRLTCQMLLCDPSERAEAWHRAVGEMWAGTTKVQISVLDAVNLVRADNRPGGNCSPLCIVYFNDREIGRTGMQLETRFPFWEDQSFLVPLYGNSQSTFRDEVCIEVYHGASRPTVFLGQVKVLAAQLYSPPLKKADYLLTARGFGPIKSLPAPQGLLGLAMEPKPRSSRGTVAQEPSQLDGTASGIRPQKWIALHILRAKDLKKADLLGKSDPYCRLLWNRKVTYTTPVRWTTLNPVWNQKYNLYFRDEDMSLTDLELRIMVHDRDIAGEDDFLGQVVLTGEQLLKGDGVVQKLQLQPRQDVTSDARAGIKGSIHLSFRSEEELPFAEALERMNLMVANPFLGLEVVQVDAEKLSLDPPGGGEGDEPAAAPSIFVKVAYGPEEIAKTGCVTLYRGEARFVHELFLFPLKKPQNDKVFGFLQEYDFSVPLKLEVFGVFPNPEPESLGPSLRLLGFLEVGLEDFSNCPTFQARYELTPPPEEKFKWDEASENRRGSKPLLWVRQSKAAPAPGKAFIVLRTAKVVPAVPRALTSLETETSFPRLRLQLNAVEVVRLAGVSLPPTQGDFSVEILFCNSQRVSVRVPVLMGKKPEQSSVKELLFSFYGISRLTDVSLLMLVTREVEDEDGQKQKHVMGEVSYAKTHRRVIR
jgi:hypothetical protein